SRAPRLFGLFEEKEWREPRPSLPELRPAERLMLDYRSKRLSIESHPMHHVRPRLRERGVLTAAELGRVPKGTSVRVAGVVICRQQPATASGVVFMTLEDETGFINLVLWQRVFETYRLPAVHASILLALGDVERQDRPVPGEVIHVVVRSLERLDVPGRDITKVSRDFH